MNDYIKKTKQIIVFECPKCLKESEIEVEDVLLELIDSKKSTEFHFQSNCNVIDCDGCGYDFPERIAFKVPHG
jgi:hypothetical protein